jgi:hypothetical protein
MAIAPVRLDRLLKFERIANADGTVNGDFQAKWQKVMEEIENSVNAVIDAQNAADAANAAAAAADAAAAAAQAAADGAQTAADNAQNAADNAQTAAEEASAATAIANSYVTGVTITATDAGASATINISAHTRYYADGTNVAVTGGSVTGLAYSTLYYIYYDQASRAGGAVTYQATTSEATAAQVGDRHTVGSVTTPAAAAPDNTGDFVYPPGVGNIVP